MTWFVVFALAVALVDLGRGPAVAQAWELDGVAFLARLVLALWALVLLAASLTTP